ncbi:hypothetical protein AVEN_227894-1, partial [Araneus ventricosus]
CEDSKTAAKISPSKVATWTVGKLHKGEFAQGASFHSISGDTWHTKPFRKLPIKKERWMSLLS